MPNRHEHARRGIRRRAITAFVLTMVMATVQAAIDHCDASCEQARAGTVASPQPPCHHATSPVARVSGPPKPCGRDHTMTRVTADDTIPVTRTVVAPLAIVSVLPVSGASPDETRISARAPDDLVDLRLPGSLSPLRI